jgi:hypothetical protein
MVDDTHTDDRTDSERPQSQSVEDTRGEQSSNEDGILTPEELAQTRRELRELDEGRAVVPTDADASPGTGERPDEQSTSPDDEPQSDVAQENGREAVTSHPTTQEFAIDVAATTNGTTAKATFASNDIRVVFADFLRWYAGEVDASRPPEEVLATLLAASELDLEVR